MRKWCAAVSVFSMLLPSFAPAQGTDVVDRVQAGVVVVGYRNADGTFAEFGSGFCIKSSSSESQFLTNDHVVHPAKDDNVPSSAQLVVVLQTSMTAVPATIVTSDASGDLAVVSAPIGNLTALKVSAKPPRTDQNVRVAAFSYAEIRYFAGLFGKQYMLPGQTPQLVPDVHRGSVTKLQNQFIHLDIQGGRIDRGMSGAPLFDAENGDVYGVIEGFLPGTGDPQSQGYAAGAGNLGKSVVSTAFVNLAITTTVVTAFLGGKSASGTTTGIAKASAVNPANGILGVAAEEGDPDALNSLGLTYYYGRNGKAKDYAQAMHYFRLAADAHNASGQNNVGLLYDLGLGVPQDYAEALRWYQLAADQGSASAQYNVGYMYDVGHGVQQNYATAMEWYRKSAAQGYADAQNNVGYLFSQGLGVKRDYVEARRWYELAAAQNEDAAQNNLGSIYGGGLGVPKDYTVAMHWYQLAAAQGDAVAQFNIGNMYQKGLGVKKDDAVAFRWFQLAANQGDPDGQVEVGVFYLTGRSVAKNYGLAMEWFGKGAAQGQTIGMNNIGYLYDTGKGVPKDYTKAMHWYQLAAAKNTPIAQYNIGYLYEHGHGVKKDIPAAIRWYRLAAAGGYTKAKTRIDKLTHQPLHGGAGR